MPDVTLENRPNSLERRASRARLLNIAMLGALAVAAIGGWSRNDPGAEIRTRRLIVVDEQGRERIELAAPIIDPASFNRTFRVEAGMVIRDDKGAERFGLGHTSTNAMTMGFDAPEGVGSSMRDRLSLGVGDDGAAWVMLINNETGVPVRLVSEAGSSGGIEFIRYGVGPDGKPARAVIRRLGPAGEETTTQSLGG